jgi:hypothetical protein
MRLLELVALLAELWEPVPRDAEQLGNKRAKREPCCYPIVARRNHRALHAQISRCHHQWLALPANAVRASERVIVVNETGGFVYEVTRDGQADGTAGSRTRSSGCSSRISLHLAGRAVLSLHERV